MKRLFKLVTVLVMLAGWPFALAAVHVVRTDGQIKYIGSMLPDWGTVQVFTKEQLSFKATFADTRTWTLVDVAAKPTLASRLIATGRGDVLTKVGTPGQIADAMDGKLPDAPPAVVPVLVPIQVAPLENQKPIKVGIGKPVELVTPATQPTKERSIFDFP